MRRGRVASILIGEVRLEGKSIYLITEIARICPERFAISEGADR